MRCPGDNLIIRCLHTQLQDVLNVRWQLNGTWLENVTLPNVEPEFGMDTGIGFLNASDITGNLNNTEIRCTVILRSERMPSTNSVTILLVQGKTLLIVHIGVVGES
jgi:hypothetical protein